MFIFVKEGIRKLSDLYMLRGNNTWFILIRWHLVARTSSFEEELAPQTRQERAECDPVPEDVLQYLSRYCTTSKIKPTLGVLRTELGAISGSQEQDDCTTEREPSHSGKPSRMGEVSSVVTFE